MEEHRQTLSYWQRVPADLTFFTSNTTDQPPASLVEQLSEALSQSLTYLESFDTEPEHIANPAEEYSTLSKLCGLKRWTARQPQRAL